MRISTHKSLNPLGARRAGRVAAALALSGLVLAATLSPGVSADQYDQQIQALQSQNAQAQQQVSSLQAQANSYQDAIAKLQMQVAALQSQIAANQQQQASLQQQIVQTQAELDRQRNTLAQDIKTIYVSGHISTIEMLATSKNLSDFVDKEEYRNAVQKNIQDTMAKMASLQASLKHQQVQVDQLLQNEQAQNAQLSADQAQQSQMLGYTQAQQNQYNQQISANTSRIAELRREQIIANERYNIGVLSGDPNHGGYPIAWNNAPEDSLVDPWGMYNRECVSYTAFKVHQDFLAGRDSHDMPYWGGAGNANQWPADARAAGIPVDYSPTPGSIAISTAGYWGHAMYVEQVGTINGQQAIYVSQYNADFTGHYSEGWRYTTGLVFLHF